MADDATERLLKEQARAHGLDAYEPEADVAPKTIAYAIRQENEKDEAALRGFAGLRGGASSSFEIGAQWTAAPPPQAPAPIGLDLSAFESVEALAGQGLDVLKAELARRGAKAGGTADERAARLWRIRGLAPGAALPADLRAKQKRPKPAKTVPEEEPARARRGPAAPPKPPKRRKKQPPQGHLIATSSFSKKERSILDFAGTSSR